MNDFLSSGHSSYELKHYTYQLQKIKHEYAKVILPNTNYNNRLTLSIALC